MIRSLFLFFVAATLFGGGVAHAICPITPARVSVGDQASDDACTYNDIQSALDAQGGSCRVVVDITREHTYTSQALTISGKSLTLQGWGDGVTCSALSQCEQLKNCTPPDSDGPLVTLSGKTGNSVLYINGSSNVTLDNLEITGGILDSTQGGGGINFSGSGSLTLSGTTIQGNYAGYGGGIAMSPSGAATLNLDEGSVIQLNSAGVNGGGILIEGQTYMKATAPSTWIRGNQAPNGYGGGILVNGPAQADIGSPGFFSLPVIDGNSAEYGGGIAELAVNDASPVVRLFTVDPNNPVRVSGNGASKTGGGVYLKPQLDSALHTAMLCANEFRIDANSAQEGTAIYADEDHHADPPDPDEYEGASVLLNLSTAPDNYPDASLCAGPQPVSALGAVACAAGAACNEIDGNVAEDINQQPTDGATILMQSVSELDAERVNIRGNQGGAALRVLTDQYGSVAELHNCLLTDNVLSGELIDATPGSGYDSTLGIDSCTLANNQIGAPYVILAQMGGSLRLTTFSLTNSIIDQPGRATVDYTSSDNHPLTLGYVLSNDISTLPGSLGILQGEPTFVDAAGGDYHLQLTSLGVDVAPTGSTSFDLDGQTRSVDLPSVANLYGPMDLGAYEIQPAADDPIFHDGFGG